MQALQEDRTGIGGHVPWLDDVQQAPRRLPRNAPRLSSPVADAHGRSIDTLAAWEERRQEIRREWLDFLRPDAIQRPETPSFQVLDEDRLPGVVRQLIRYETEPGLPVEAFLLKPAHIEGRCPGVLALHSTVPYTIRQPAGLEGPAEKAFGLKAAQRGCVALCPRCFLWPDARTTRFSACRKHFARLRRQRAGILGMTKMLCDAQTAVDLLAALPEVDAQRLGAVGHSLGAKEALYLAAFDSRIRVAVSSEGGIGRDFSNWSDPWYLGKPPRGPAGRREHHELLALVAPRAFLLVAGESADGDRSWPFIAAALPAYQLYGGRPRLGLFNHRQGHAVPSDAERRIHEWLETYS